MSRLAVVLAGLAGVLAGCGGGSADGDAMSREDFIARANEICRDARAEADYPRNPETDEEIAGALEEAAAVIRRLDSRLRALSPPPELANDVEAWLADNDVAVDMLEEAADTVRKEGRLAILGMTGVLAEIERKSDQLSRKIGATGCVGPE